MEQIAILGTGGLGRETHEALERMIAHGARAEFVGFLDDRAQQHGQRIHGGAVIGGRDWLADRPDVRVCVAVGAPAMRRRIVDALHAAGHRAFATIVDPRAAVGSRVEVGEGSIVLQGASVTTDARLGRHVVVNPGALVAHDDVLDDFVLVAPGAAVSGAVRVREGADLGTNCAILQGLEVGAWSVVGAGAVVLEPVPPNATVVGVPARVIKTRPNGWQTHL